MQPEIEDLQQLDPSRSLLAGPPHDKTAELLLTEAPRYKNVLETNTAKVKDRYDSYMAPIKYADTVAKFKHKYAVGRAFQVLGVTQPADIRYSLKYNEVQRIAAEVEKDPEFMTAQKFVEYEPSVEAVFNYLVPKYVETKIYSAVVESATCEHAARRMAMENATDNAREMLDDLNLNYNRARQAAITDQIIEIVAGAEAQN